MEEEEWETTECGNCNDEVEVDSDGEGTCDCGATVVKVGPFTVTNSPNEEEARDANESAFFTVVNPWL